MAVFRLAVHLKRLGIPSDLAVSFLKDWSHKNKPESGKIITTKEVAEQTRWCIVSKEDLKEAAVKHEAYRNGQK